MSSLSPNAPTRRQRISKLLRTRPEIHPTAIQDALGDYGSHSNPSLLRCGLRALAR